MRFVDVLLSLPGILFAMALIAVLGRSQTAALVAVGITGIPSFARITRAQVLSLRKRDFVTAVEALGGSSSYNMFRTVLPNSWSPILVQVVILSSVAILIEASLAFLGLVFHRPRRVGARCCVPANRFYMTPHLCGVSGAGVDLHYSLARHPGAYPGQGARRPPRDCRGRAMMGFILRRLLQLLPVLLIASTGIWAMIYAVPGNPVAAMVGENATPEQVQAVTVRLGLTARSMCSTGLG